MAFIDFSDAGASEALRAAHRIAIVEQADDLLSQLERRVIELARHDGLESLKPLRQRRWLARLIFGPTPPSKTLANEKLEALRKLAVMAWNEGFTLPTSAIREALAAGHSEAKVGAVVDFVARLQAPVRRIAA